MLMGWQNAAALPIVRAMSRVPETSNRLIRSRWGQALAWLAVSLLLLQMWGGASFLMRLVAAEDSFALASLQFLCTGLPTAAPFADTGGLASKRAGDERSPADGSQALGHAHCLLCPDHVTLFVLATLPGLLIGAVLVAVVSVRQHR